MEQNLQEVQEAKIDIDEFDRNLRKIMFELQRKRILLEEYQQKLNEAILKQQDLERQLKNEKQKNSNDEYRNIILQNAAEALEEERLKYSKELINLKVEFELAVAERDSLRNQVRSQCLEINNLKRQVDDLSSKHECHNDFQNDISEQLNKFKNSLNLVNDLMIPLRKKQEELVNAAQATNISEHLLLSAKQLQKHITIIKEERDSVEKKLIIKSAEFSKLQQLMDDNLFITKMDDNDSILEYWKETCKDLKYHLDIEKEGNEKLTNTLKLSHENSEHLRKKVLQSEDKISDLEQKLKLYNKNKSDVMIQTETTDDIIEIVDLVKSESSEK